MRYLDSFILIFMNSKKICFIWIGTNMCEATHSHRLFLPLFASFSSEIFHRHCGGIEDTWFKFGPYEFNGWKSCQKYICVHSMRTKSMQIVEMDIDQRLRKLIEFYWPIASFRMLHSQINVFPASFPWFTSLQGLEKLQLGSKFEKSTVGERLKKVTDVWGTAKLHGIVGKSVCS